MEIEEILEQLEFEKSRHEEIAKVTNQPEFKQEHERSARRIKNAILLIQHVATRVRP